MHTEEVKTEKFWGSLVSQLSLFGELHDSVRDLVSKIIYIIKIKLKRSPKE